MISVMILMSQHHEVSSVHAQDPRSNVTQLIQYWGYPVEQHFVTTADGFVLSMYVIISSNNYLKCPHNIITMKIDEQQAKNSIWT